MLPSTLTRAALYDSQDFELVYFHIVLINTNF